MSLGPAAFVLWASGILSTIASGVTPAPQGLEACKPGDPTSMMIANVASRFGTPSGCFVSKEMYQLHGATHTISQPTEYAFAITISASPTGPFTTDSVSRMFSNTSEKWKNVDALWQSDEANYEKRINQLIQGISSKDASSPEISVEQPLLVSMERLDPNSYAVVSLRKRVVSIAGDSSMSTKAEGAAIVLRNGSLIRLSIARELENKSDVDNVKKAITSWAHEVEGSGS